MYQELGGVTASSIATFGSNSCTSASAEAEHRTDKPFTLCLRFGLRRAHSDVVFGFVVVVVMVMVIVIEIAIVGSAFVMCASHEILSANKQSPDRLG